MIEQPWIEKYKPQKIRDLVGNSTAISKVTEWLQKWPKSISRSRRALMLFGSAGVGKTIVVHTIAKELTFEVTEINANVKRSKRMLHDLLKISTMTGTLTTKRGRIVLIDELAGLSGKSDRGAASAIKDHIQKTRVPIILVTNDISEPKIKPLLKLCTLIEFHPIQNPEMVAFLKTICLKEKLQFEEPALETLASKSRGDLRAAINDLQNVSKTKSQITNEMVLEFLKTRDQKIDLSESLNRIFYAETWGKAVYAANQTDVYPDELIRWVSNNVPSVFPDIEQQAKAFDLLSTASIFSRRLSRTQNWRLLPYSKELMCITGSIIEGTPTPKRPDYSFPDWIRQMGFSRSVRQKRSLIGQLLAPIVHLSTQKAYQEYHLVLKALLRNPNTKEAFTKEIELPEELIQFILKD